MKEIILRTPTVTEDAEESALARDQKRLNHWKSMLVTGLVFGAVGGKARDSAEWSATDWRRGE